MIIPQFAASEYPPPSQQGQSSIYGSLDLHVSATDERYAWLLTLGVPTGTADKLAKVRRCECGQPAAAVGVFLQLTSADVPVRNAMWLCASCAGKADQAVQIYVLATKPKGNEYGRQRQSTD